MDQLTFAIIASLAGLLTAGIVWFLVMIHTDLRGLRTDLAKLMAELPLDYLRKADYLDDYRANRRAIRHVHRRIDALVSGKPLAADEDDAEDDR
jgi:hypothetical protein